MRTIALCLAAVAIAAAQSGVQKFRARLAPTPIDATMRADVTGSGAATATLAGAKLTIAGTFAGLRGPATAARLLAGPATGVRGKPVAELAAVKAESGEVKGAVELTPAQVEDLRKGRLYLQIDTEKANNGALWGWLLR
jgi:hypothetical protein